MQQVLPAVQLPSGNDEHGLLPVDDDHNWLPVVHDTILATNGGAAQVNFESLVPFVLLLVAVFGLWVHRNLWVAALILAVASGWVTGALRTIALLWIAILVVLALAFRWQRARGGSLYWLTGFAFLLFALACALLLLPGFERTTLVPDTVLSPGASPFNVGLGFPKVVTGILILGLLNETRIRGLAEAGVVARRTAPIFLITVIAALVCVFATGYVAFAPKWTTLFIPWAIANLFFTCLAEEAFFRGFVQHELARLGQHKGSAAGLAVVVSAVLFGLAHFGGGWRYVLVATVAGVGYGWAYQRTQRIEAAMAVHFAANSLHFLLFTYPRLAT
jgi:membrane protease YdiL (CAAX protease family)